MILVDACVLLDVVSDDPTWGRWSGETLSRLANRAVLAINPIVYAEVSAGFAQVEHVESALPHDVLRRLPLPYEASFLAGRAFVRYRRRGGVRRSPLPDFFIGAHAAVAGLELLTRDPRRFRDHFPTVPLITPVD